MNKEMIKKYRAMIVFVIIMVAGCFYFFYHFGHHDAQALTDFSIAYQSYDKAISDFSTAILASSFNDATAADDFELNTDEALVELTSKASARISSLTKNDAELMSITQEIADLSRKELDALIACRRAIIEKNTDVDNLCRELGDLTNIRKTDYARFRELAGLKD